MSETSASPQRSGRRTVYLESRYRKLERGLPQTIFWCPECKGDRRRRVGCDHCGGRGKLSEESVQELIGRVVLPAYRARTGKFHGAGREDRDVLMLGLGRPYVYEVVGARNLDVDLEELLCGIHERARGRIELAPFTLVGRSRIAYWKEARFAKRYRAEVELQGAVDDARLRELVGWKAEVAQRTPRRVAHRRADLERKRRVAILSAERTQSGRLTVGMECAHGTYVKEWISGDAGRTSPSLAELLGVPCRCEVLDVEEVLTNPDNG